MFTDLAWTGSQFLIPGKRATNEKNETGFQVNERQVAVLMVAILRRL